MEERDAAGRGDLDDVGDTGITLEFGADPDLVNLAALGDQQFTNRLTALDLAPSEPLRRTGARARLT